MSKEVMKSPEKMECVRCGGALEEGFMLERSGLLSVPEMPLWLEGWPVADYFNGVTRDGRRKFKVATFRCAECGRLESFARELYES